MSISPFRSRFAGSARAALPVNLLGAAFGQANLPAAWLPDLELAPLIERIANDP
jgi:hypothetical protein